MMRTYYTISLLSVLLLTSNPLLANPKTAGTVEFSRGIATAQQTGQAPRIIGKDGTFYENEVLSTSDKSFIVIRLKDNSRMTLRPNTQFAVERINANKKADDDAILQLFKGGLRAVTGFISKYTHNSSKARYQVKTPVATIGIRGTEFDARICENDCQQSGANKNRQGPTAAAKIAFLRGSLTARNKQGQNRTLKTGSPVYEGDTVATSKKGFAVLAFSDNSRISLQPDTLFRVERFRFRLSKGQKEEESAILNLIKGGLRAITGLMGKSSPGAYRVKTPVATIGIRGTGFDLQCQGKCVDRFRGSYKQEAPETLLQQVSKWLIETSLIKTAHAQPIPSGSGLYAHVWSGSIEFQLANRTLLLSENQTAFLRNQQSQPLILPELPPQLKNPSAPRPDKIKIQEDIKFENETSNAEPGLYVSVDDGKVEVNGVSVAPGEAVFSGSDEQSPVKLTAIPEFITQDPFPKPNNLNESSLRLLQTPDNSQDEFECEVR